MASPDARFSPAHLKWIVIGIVGITFMFIFKDDLSNMIKRADKVKIGPGGILITRTIQTPLGRTIISGPPTLDTAGITPQSLPNYQSHKGYAINWPQDGSWSEHPDLAKAINADLVIAYNYSQEDFTPNVNITTEPTGGMSIKQWMENTNTEIANMGLAVTDVQIDTVNNSGVRIVRGDLFGSETNMIQRIIFDQGHVYIATALRPLNYYADPKLWQDLNKILNSFRINRQ